MFEMIAVKLVVGLIALIVITRFLGKKEMAQATPFDFVYAIMLGGILENAIYDHSISVFNVLFAYAVWGILIYIIEILVKRIDMLRKPLKGEPSELIVDGNINIKEMERTKMETEQLRLMLRQQGIFSLKEVGYALLETTGTLSVIRSSEYSNAFSQKKTEGKLQLHPSVLVIDEGKLKHTNIKKNGLKEDWILKELKQQGYSSVSEIYYAEWTKGEGFYLKAYTDCL